MQLGSVSTGRGAAFLSECLPFDTNIGSPRLSSRSIICRKLSRRTQKVKEMLYHILVDEVVKNRTLMSSSRPTPGQISLAC